MEFLKKYGYVFLFIAAAFFFLAAANIPERRSGYLTVGIMEFAAGVVLMKKSRRA